MLQESTEKLVRSDTQFLPLACLAHGSSEAGGGSTGSSMNLQGCLPKAFSKLGITCDA
ncbi:hypothetical protein F751_2105 [Auxenochlorella protothecoides]|uniref:Uncharacterized protein n=2 Tax=Auxenochlorella protothecoides TaxID=3075 RepID=A0A087SLB4_AUXPR|nr:hypothetical protein F751_2105 [Auxenochlorella protothecoides]KFM26518.1 hypothetical protein F751_2105 [Auxenochlorella protothecoides]